MSVDDRRGAHTQKDFFDTHGHRSNMDGRDGRLSDLHGVVFIQLESSDWENIHGLLYPIFHSRCGLFYGLHAHISIFEVPISSFPFPNPGFSVEMGDEDTWFPFSDPRVSINTVDEKTAYSLSLPVPILVIQIPYYADIGTNRPYTACRTADAEGAGTPGGEDCALGL